MKNERPGLPAKFYVNHGCNVASFRCNSISFTPEIIIYDKQINEKERSCLIPNEEGELQWITSQFSELVNFEVQRI